MKNIFLFICLWAVMVQICYSQDYEFSLTTSSYSNLSGSQSAPQKILWWNYEYTIPISFPFKISGKVVDSIDISDIGAIRFRPNRTGYSSGYLFFGFGASLSERNMDTSQSRICYLAEGQIGQRIFKIEYYQCGFINNGSSSDSVNFQIWLYESDYSIETHIGPTFSSDPGRQFINGKGPAIGLMDGNEKDVTSYALMLTGEAASPTPLDTSNIYQLPCLNGPPQSGSVYRFVPVN